MTPLKPKTRFQRILSRIAKPLGLMTKQDVQDFAKALEEAKRRTPTESNWEAMNKIVELPYNYETLIKYALNNEVVRTVHEAIIKEVTRNRWDIKPRWLRKCPECGAEFQTEKQQCPECQIDTVKPDENQKKVLKAFIDDPNRDDEMIDIIKSILRYILAVDDWYLSIQYANYESPLTIYVEDSVNMRVVADKYGRLGNGQYFCPIETRDDPASFYDAPGRCPNHPDVELKETAYVYVEGGQIKARFSRDEVIHEKTDPWLPSHHGNSKLISCIRIVLSIIAMDKWNFDTYTTGKLAQILVFHGLDQTQVNDLMLEAKKQRDKLEEDPNTATISNKLRTLGLATKEGVTKVDAMPPAEKMQSLDWWKLWREVVCGVYGVTPVFVNVVESGKTGSNPRMQIDVQNNTTEMYQHGIEDPFNNMLLPKLGVTDWQFKFNPVEEKDEMQDISVLQAKVETVIRAANAGMQAELTDEGEVKISGKPKSQQFEQDISHYIKPVKKPTALKPNQPFIEENPFAQEKGEKLKKVKSWIVTEIDSDSASCEGSSTN